jgi:phosphate transport system permease protein
MMTSLSRRKNISHVMTAMTGLFAALAITALVLILGYIAVTGVRELSLGFLVNEPKPAGEPGSGIANAIVGTLILISIASVVGLPIGILAGLYLAEFGTGRVGAVIRFLIDTLTGVPSIVIGVFAWTIMVRPMGHFSALAGGVALAIIRLVPHSMREAALALGAPVWRMSLGVVLRAAAGGVATGAMLAIARIAGETAPLLFTALSYTYLSTDINQPIASLTYQIYYYAGAPYEEWHSMAWASTLVLVGMILFINVVVKVLARNRHQ